MLTRFILTRELKSYTLLSSFNMNITTTIAYGKIYIDPLADAYNDRHFYAYENDMARDTFDYPYGSVEYPT